MTYRELINQLKPTMLINFREYSLNFRGIKHMTLNIESSVIEEVIPANQSIGRSKLEIWYGNDLSNKDYLQLSTMNCFRIILIVGVDEFNKPQYKPIVINQDLFETGFQEVDILLVSTSVEEPIYVANMTF